MAVYDGWHVCPGVCTSACLSVSVRGYARLAANPYARRVGVRGVAESRIKLAMVCRKIRRVSTAARDRGWRLKSQTDGSREKKTEGNEYHSASSGFPPLPSSLSLTPP
eukprot:GHVU01184576.1.p2 GENE.GHVU01184576.1~~GHVU01184576.1.p2  ORF type:complete len:108 (-),score=7.00 GHVU01184576.1:104-427(-)